jgi:hypothetical protein
MDLARLTAVVEETAIASDAEAAGRVIVIYVAPGDAGLFVFRPGCGVHQLGGAGEDDFAGSIRSALVKLWPEASKKTHQWLTIAADFLARSPIGKKLAGRSADEEG